MLQLTLLIVLWLAGLAMQYYVYGTGIVCIASLLFSVIFLSVYSILPETEKGIFRFSGYMIWIYLAAAVFIPPLRPFLGAAILLVPPGIPCPAVLPALIPFALFAARQNFPETGCLLFLICIGFIGNMMFRSLRFLQDQFVSLRDTAREQQLTVEEKNKALRESQDAKVHLATLQERNRIAREIHDHVGHMLTRSILQTGAIKTVNKDPGLALLLDGLHETLNTAMNNIRESVHDLHDESVDLGVSLKDILGTARNFETDLQIDPGLSVPKNVKYGFIAIVKEAVNNAVKYSNGNRITVILREHPGFYQLLIEDNGKTGASAKSDASVKSGIANPSDVRSGSPDKTDGIGIENIRDRVREMGGTVSISTGDCFRYTICIMK